MSEQERSIIHILQTELDETVKDIWKDGIITEEEKLLLLEELSARGIDTENNHEVKKMVRHYLHVWDQLHHEIDPIIAKAMEDGVITRDETLEILDRLNLPHTPGNMEIIELNLNAAIAANQGISLGQLHDNVISDDLIKAAAAIIAPISGKILGGLVTANPGTLVNAVDSPGMEVEEEVEQDI